MDTHLSDSTKLHARYLIELVVAAILKNQPPEPPEGLSFERLYTLAKNHEVLNTVFYSIEKLNNKPEPVLYKKWMNYRNKCVHRNMIQRNELEQICSAFEENGIGYMPLKGLRIAQLYPASDYRFMSDLDILVVGDRGEAEKILLSMGYTVKKGKADYDKGYVKPPFMFVELHNSLFPKYSRFREYYSDIIERCTKNGCEYKMTYEDFYIYHLVHMYKHFSKSGTGIRSVIDHFLLYTRLLPAINMDYVNAELIELDIYEFSESISQIALKWFEGDLEEFSDDEVYILTSGCYGTLEHSVENHSREMGKWGYFKLRVFPPKEIMTERFPVLNKHPYLYPLYYALRFFRGLFLKREQLMDEAKLLKKK